MQPLHCQCSGRLFAGCAGSGSDRTHREGADVSAELAWQRLREILDRWVVQVKHNVQVLGDRFPHLYSGERGEGTTDGGWTEE